MSVFQTILTGKDCNENALQNGLESRGHPIRISRTPPFKSRGHPITKVNSYFEQKFDHHYNWDYKRVLHD